MEKVPPLDGKFDFFHEVLEDHSLINPILRLKGKISCFLAVSLSLFLLANIFRSSENASLFCTPPSALRLSDSRSWWENGEKEGGGSSM